MLERTVKYNSDTTFITVLISGLFWPHNSDIRSDDQRWAEGGGVLSKYRVRNFLGKYQGWLKGRVFLKPPPRIEISGKSL